MCGSRCRGCRRLRWNPLSVSTASTNLTVQSRAALKRVGLDDHRAAPLAETSYGEKRRIEIAMALAQKAESAAARRAVRGLRSTSAATCASLLTRSRAT